MYVNYVRMYVFMYVFVCICMHVCVCVCMDGWMCVYYGSHACMSSYLNQMLSSTTMYHIWKALSFSMSLKHHPLNWFQSILLDIVHTLKGQWDGIIGDSDAKIAQQHEFITTWKATPSWQPIMVLLIAICNLQNGCFPHSSHLGI